MKIRKKLGAKKAEKILMVILWRVNGGDAAFLSSLYHKIAGSARGNFFSDVAALPQ